MTIQQVPADSSDGYVTIDGYRYKVTHGFNDDAEVDDTTAVVAVVSSDDEEDREDEEEIETTKMDNNEIDDLGGSSREFPTLTYYFFCPTDRRYYKTLEGAQQKEYHFNNNNKKQDEGDEEEGQQGDQQGNNMNNKTEDDMDNYSKRTFITTTDDDECEYYSPEAEVDEIMAFTTIEEGQTYCEDTLVITSGKRHIAWLTFCTLLGWFCLAIVIVNGTDYHHVVFVIFGIVAGLFALFYSYHLVIDIRKKMILSFNNNPSSGGDGGNNDVMIHNGLFIPTKEFTLDEVGPIILKKTYREDGSNRTQYYQPVYWDVHVKDSSPHHGDPNKLNNLFSCRIDRHQADKLETLFQQYQPGKLKEVMALARL